MVDVVDCIDEESIRKQGASVTQRFLLREPPSLVRRRIAIHNPRPSYDNQLGRNWPQTQSVC